MDDTVRDYIVRLVHATRDHSDLALGASPRGSLALFKTAQALAALRGRDFVLPDDVKALAIPTLAHRLIVRPESALRGYTAERILRTICCRQRPWTSESWTCQNRTGARERMCGILPFLIVLLAVAFFTKVDFFFYLLYALFGIYVLGRLWARRSLAAVTLTRRHDPRVFLGRAFAVEVERAQPGLAAGAVAAPDRHRPRRTDAGALPFARSSRSCPASA